MTAPAVGRIEQLNDIPGQRATFFGEPMVGITVKQHEEYLALRARAAEICTWTRDAVPEYEIFATACGEEFALTDGDVSDLNYCHKCGRKVEVKL